MVGRVLFHLKIMKLLSVDVGIEIGIGINQEGNGVGNGIFLWLCNYIQRFRFILKNTLVSVRLLVSQWWTAIYWIYSSTVLKCNFEYFRSQYSTFYPLQLFDNIIY